MYLRATTILILMDKHKLLMGTKKIENPHPLLFIFINWIDPITLVAHYLTSCSHDVRLPNGKVIKLCIVSLQSRSTSHAKRWSHWSTTKPSSNSFLLPHFNYHVNENLI